MLATGCSLFIGAALAFGLIRPAAGQAPIPPTQDTLRVVFSPDKFSSVNRNDALAAFKAWIETVGRRRGINLLVEADSYSSVPELQQVVRSRAADLLVLRSLEYLGLEKEREMLDPVFMPERRNTIQQTYLLLTRRDRHLTLADLRGKKILLVNSLGTGLSRAWMADVLRQAGLGTLNDFSPIVEDANKPSAAILPVYFGKADACVVDAESFTVMKELNPQIGQALEAGRTSTPYLETIICVRGDYVKNRAELIEGLAELHEEASGRQILLVFKVDRLVPFENRALDTVRELRATVGRITGIASR